MKNPPFSRRTAIKGMTAATVTGAISSLTNAQSATPSSPLELGLDGHSLRGMKWKSLDHIQYAAKQNLQAVLFNGPHYFESLDKSHLQTVKAAADDAGLRIFIGAGGISEGAKSYKDTHGSGAGTLREGIRIAKALGSPVVNCRIGNIDDRYSEGGIEARLEEAARSLHAVKSEAMDTGLKFAFENHAGDTRSDEILELISDVGSDVLGVMIDPGNAIWALEDPMEHLAKLSKHVLCCSVRDYMVWESEEGATFQWTAIGEGLMEVETYASTLLQDAPDVPLFVESISNSARPIPFLDPAFWSGFPDLRAAEMRDFLDLCRRGAPLKIATAGSDQDPKEFDREHQKAEFERSIDYLRSMNSVGA